MAETVIAEIKSSDYIARINVSRGANCISLKICPIFWDFTPLLYSLFNGRRCNDNSEYGVLNERKNDTGRSVFIK